MTDVEGFERGLQKYNAFGFDKAAFVLICEFQYLS